MKNSETYAKSKRTLKPKAKEKGKPKSAVLAGKERNTKNSKLSKQKRKQNRPIVCSNRSTTTSNRTGYGGSSEPGDAEKRQKGRNLAGKY